MFFGKKNRDLRKCESCGSRSDVRYRFCPQCGNNFVDARKHKEDYGLLGTNDSADEDVRVESFGMMDKLLNSMIHSMMKNLDKQMKNQFRDFEKDMQNAEVRGFPNGIRIKISGPMSQGQQKRPAKKKVRQDPMNRPIGETQLAKMGKLPRTKAKTQVKRFGDSVVYELATPGVTSTDDVFVSKLESGYEVKAIGDKKIYVNSVPINLPLKRYSILKNKLLIEFLSEHEQ